MEETIKKLLTPGKGILAADESFPTIEKRFAEFKIDSTEESRRAYRQMLLATPNLEQYISGVILFDETIKQKTDDGVFFPDYLNQRGIVPGIKIDQGTIDFGGHPGEKITQGLEGLIERLVEYKGLGARFTKFRSVITIGEGLPTQDCLKVNADILAQFAKGSQSQDLVPIVEPEVVMDGDHGIEVCQEATTRTLKIVFAALKSFGVDIAQLLLKINMVLPGSNSHQAVNSGTISKSTLTALRTAVPKEVPGVVFLSGGQSPAEACENLNEIKRSGVHPWEISFSYARALQAPALAIWRGRAENVNKAQNEFLKRAKLASLAREGEYKTEMEEA